MQEDQEQPLALADLRVVLSEWESIREAKGYERYMQYARDQLARRGSDLRQPECACVDFVRGECSGIALFSSMPDIEIERLKEEIEARIDIIKQEEEDDDGQEHELGSRRSDEFTA